MPSLILTGHPCVGKTTFARLLATQALRHSSNLIQDVVHITESSARPDQTKAECYRNSHNEKVTRAALKSEFDRAVMSGKSGVSGDDTSKTLVILDSLNYIKGYRYELYCISKAAGERHGVIWIMGSDEDERGLMEEKELSESDALAKERNLKRKERVISLKQQHQKQEREGTDDSQNFLDDEKSIESDGFFEDDETIDALILRYEPPDDKNRWEKPLYKVNLAKVHPWGKGGTLETASNPTTEDKLVNKMKRVNVESASDEAPKIMETVKVAPKKSVSGFKRSKKSTQQRLAKQMQSVRATGELSANDTAYDASASSIPGVENDDKRKMEDVINEILDSFLMDIKPLKEGLSTQSMVSAESNVSDSGIEKSELKFYQLFFLDIVNYFS
ncbi:hypothetical protein ACHAXS_008553 [Conticribra weissflogii]